MNFSNFSINYFIYEAGEPLHFTIEYDCIETPFGVCALALIDQRIVKLAFFDSMQQENNFKSELIQEWGVNNLIKKQFHVKNLIKQIFMPETKKEINLSLFLKGSPFQIKVWQALLNIPFGQLVTYQDIAKSIGQESAVRATATAIGKNPIAYLIPCHRVIRKNGEIGEYRWQAHRKESLIALEKQLYCDGLGLALEASGCDGLKLGVSGVGLGNIL